MEQKKKTKKAAVRGRQKAMKRYGQLTVIALSLFLVLIGAYVVTVVQEKNEIRTQENLKDLFGGKTNSSFTTRFDLFGGVAFADELPSTEGLEITERFKELYEINSDVVGWVKASDTIDSPVVYRDNEYYIDHDFYEKSSSYGAIFADIKCAPWERDPFVILYGHNMKNGTMFGDLDDYRTLDYLKQNSIVEYYSINKEEAENYVPVSIFDASMLSNHDTYFNLRRFDEFSDPALIQEYLNEIASRSLFDIPVDVTPEDRLLVLVTCSYDDIDGRLMVFARELREGENVEDMKALVSQSVKK